MNARREILTRLLQIVSEQLGVRQDQVVEEATWLELGADSLDRLALSLAVEKAFQVEIPHTVGERLDTVGKTVDHLDEYLTAVAVYDRQRYTRLDIASGDRPPLQ